MTTKEGEAQSTIVRRRTNDPFARIPKAMLEDDQLTWKAKGILAYLLGKPDGWEPRLGDLIHQGDDGPTAVRNGLRELRENGYAQLQKVYRNGRVDQWLLVISDRREFTPTLSVTVIRERGGKLQVENRNLAPEPDPELLQVENRQVENRALSNTEETKPRKNQEKEKSDPGTKAKAGSENDVIAYAESIGLPPSDGTFFWNKWEANGWTINGKRIRDWAAIIRQWKAAGYLPSQKNGGTNGAHRGNGQADRNALVYR